MLKKIATNKSAKPYNKWQNPAKDDGNSADQEMTQEEEIMGGSDKAGSKKSEIMGKNLDQMINVLHARLKSLEDCTNTRIRLCKDDLNPISKNMSKQAKTLLNEYDEVIPKSLKEAKGSTIVHKDNLVSSDTVYIDPYHLVLRTKASTDTAKKLEMSLEETFGNPNFRDMKNKKKQGTHTEKSKKSEQLKNEAKRINRMRLEKRLQSNMENFVTRSVMDPELMFRAPDDADADEPVIRWPIPVKWSQRDPRSQSSDNNDGEFEPELLLLYSLERINLPSGKNMFTWLMRQVILQRYFVSLFWMIKVKFFELDSEPYNESFLLSTLSVDYRKIVNLLVQRAHAEHEKDFVYRYLPFILANALFFSFYFLCPGSRHLYTKGFKKTIYMQIVQIMHGIQICPMTVKVSWAKLFPEDTHDDGGDAADDGQQQQDSAEVFPLKMALTKPKSMKTFTDHRGGLNSSSLRKSTLGFDPLANGSNSPGVGRGAYLADESDGIADQRGGVSLIDLGHPTIAGGSSNHTEVHNTTTHANNPTTTNNTTTNTFPPELHSQLSRTMSMGLTDSDEDHYVKTTAKDFFMLDFFEEQAHQDPLMRTSLKAPMERPGPKFYVKRQNNIETLNAHQMSPQIQLLLNAKTSSKLNSVLQPIHRTLPVSWCPAGGTDTHRRPVIAVELQQEFMAKLKKSKEEFSKEGHIFHKQKVQLSKELDKSLAKVLRSGTTSISRFSLDLIRRQRSLRTGGDGIANLETQQTAAAITSAEEINMAEILQLAQYDDSELDRFLMEN